MRHLNVCLLFLVVGGEALAAPALGAAERNKPGCGDYSILADPAHRAEFERHCGTNDEEDFEKMRVLVARLDPKKEAVAAAKRGDFRLAAFTDGGPPPPEQTRRWHVQGVQCKNLEDQDVFVWVRLSDALTPALDRTQSDMRRFAASYNLAIIYQPGFPAQMGCLSIRSTMPQPVGPPK